MDKKDYSGCIWNDLRVEQLKELRSIMTALAGISNNYFSFKVAQELAERCYNRLDSCIDGSDCFRHFIQENVDPVLTADFGADSMVVNDIIYALSEAYIQPDTLTVGLMLELEEKAQHIVYQGSNVTVLMEMGYMCQEERKRYAEENGIVS